MKTKGFVNFALKINGKSLIDLLISNKLCHDKVIDMMICDVKTGGKIVIKTSPQNSIKSGNAFLKKLIGREVVILIKRRKTNEAIQVRWV